jgi:iron(III) transport system substrate-binding protein
MFPDPHGTVINRKLFPENLVPLTFKDFLNPVFKGKMLLNDPRVPGGGNIYHLYMHKIYGEEYLEELKEYVVLERRYPVGIRAVASGEYLMYLGVAARMCKGMEEIGIDVIYPEAPIISIAQMAILDGPHPHAAKLYLNFSLSKIGQDMATKFANRVPVRKDVKGVAKIVDVGEMKVLIPSYHEDMVEKAKRRDEAKALWPQ